MRILDRYTFKSILGLFMGCLFIFMFLYIAIDLLSHLEEILKQQVNFNILRRYYSAYLPIIFVNVAPIACLISVLYTFGRMNRENEIIAMRASGLSIFQITKTAIVFGAIVAILVFWAGEKFVPQSLSLTQKIKDQIEKGTKKDPEKEREVIPNLSMYGSRNRLFFINKFFPGKNSMEGIIILEHDEHQNLTKKIQASKGVYQDGLWRFYQSMTYEFNKDGQIKQEPQYLDDEIMGIPETPGDFLNQMQHPDFMNIPQLNDYIWKLSKSGATSVIRNLKVDLYQRFSSPLTSMIIMLLGIPFSLKMRKRATGLSSIGISLMVGFLYYVLNAVCLALGKSGLLTPILAAFLSHALVFTSTIYLIKTMP